MTRISIALACTVVAFAAAGCKIVKNKPEGEKAIAADASGDDARIEQRLADSFDSQLAPYIAENAQTVASLRQALAAGLDEAGAAHGTKGSGAGAAWNFPVQGEGMVVSSKLDTRARVAGVDTDGDGAADVTVQLGPVIKGTALRDVAPFYNFDDFRDQIEFAKLARALNDRISAGVVLPEDGIDGRAIGFSGVVALKKADEPFVVTPLVVEFTP
ncbi:MAG: DUF2291 domain-containing protein [Geminicoccaceae bacterium]